MNMSIKSKLNQFVQMRRDAAAMSVYEVRALTNNYEACHGDFALLPDYYAENAARSTEDTALNYTNRKVAFAQ